MEMPHQDLYSAVGASGSTLDTMEREAATGGHDVPNIVMREPPAAIAE